MQPELEHFDRLWKSGEREEAKRVAREYIEDHRHQIAPLLEPYSLEGLVELIDAYRRVGKEEDRIIVDMWLLTEYEPQRIAGAFVLGNPRAAVKEVQSFLQQVK